ncbi:QacE family quaternary ammonium compound efflux SMR transporter, partial [bacterium]|nr:QacE family quaternary ammonium compound efflux SMR transporter [bacterium]
MSYIYLSGAIFCEVIGTMVLPLSENFSKPIPSFISIVAYVLAFYLL